MGAHSAPVGRQTVDSATHSYDGSIVGRSFATGGVHSLRDERSVHASEGISLPVATPEQYVAMLDAAKRDRYAYAAVNISSSSTLTAALAGFAEAQSDGIVQLTPSGAEFASGNAGNAAAGARAIAAFARSVADSYPVLIALHTDHCPPTKVESFLRPLLEESAARVRRNDPPLVDARG